MYERCTILKAEKTTTSDKTTPSSQSEFIKALGGTCPTCGQRVPKKKACPKCGSERVEMFDADEDFCLTCKTRFNGT